MLDWLAKIKGSITDSMAYDFVVAKVEAMQTAVESKNAQMDLLRERVEQLSSEKVELASQLASERTTIAATKQELADCKNELARFHEREQFDVISGIAFKRGKKKGEHEESPRCPNCFSFMGFDAMHSFTDYLCPSCKYKVIRGRMPESLLNREKR